MDNYEKIIDKNNGIIYAYKLANYKMLWDWWRNKVSKWKVQF